MAGISLHGANLAVINSRIADNVGGIHMWGSAVHLKSGVTIENNSHVGVNATLGSRIHIESNTTIRRNNYFGIWLGDTSVVGGNSQGGILITENLGTGVFCDAAPAVAHIAPDYGSGVRFSINESHVFGNFGSYQINCPGIVVPTPSSIAVPTPSSIVK